MDAKEFLREYKRMCDYFDSDSADPCEGCPLHEAGFEFDCDTISMAEDADTAVALVEKWSQENPIPTLTLQDAIAHISELLDDPEALCDPTCRSEHKQLRDWLMELERRQQKDLEDDDSDLSNAEKFVKVFGPVPGFELICNVKEPRVPGEKVHFIAHRLEWWKSQYEAPEKDGDGAA